MLHGLGLIDDLEQVPLTLERDGRREDVVLAAPGLGPLMARDTDRSWEVPVGWVDARGAREGWPFWLQQPGDKFWFEYLAPEHVLYVQLNEVGDKPDQTVAAFADSLFAFARATRSTASSSISASTGEAMATSTVRSCSASSGPIP